MSKFKYGLRLKDTFDTALLKKNKQITGIVDTDRIATEFVKSHQFTKIYNEDRADLQDDMIQLEKDKALKRKFEEDYKTHIDYINDEIDRRRRNEKAQQQMIVTPRIAPKMSVAPTSTAGITELFERGFAQKQLTPSAPQKEKDEYAIFRAPASASSSQPPTKTTKDIDLAWIRNNQKYNSAQKQSIRMSLTHGKSRDEAIRTMEENEKYKK